MFPASGEFGLMRQAELIGLIRTVGLTPEEKMASLKDLRKYIIGPPQTGAGVYGRAGGVAPAVPTRPIANLRTQLAGPVMQQNFAPQAAAQQPMPPAPAPAQMPVRPAPAPTPSPEAATAASLRNYTERPYVPNPVETVPFNPPDIKGEVLEDELPNVHTGGDYLAPTTLMEPSNAMHAKDEEGAIDLGTLPTVNVGGDPVKEEREWNAAAQELASRMLRASRLHKRGGPTNRGIPGSVLPWEN